MTTDEGFKSFVSEWVKERVWPIDDFLEFEDREYIAKRRAAELARLCDEQGFQDALINAATPFGGVVQFVKQQYWNVELDAQRLPGLKDLIGQTCPFGDPGSEGATSTP